MAVQWSSENIIAKHQSIGATAMGLDSTGSFALLAAKRTMFLIDLDKPQDVVKKLSRMHQKYEVSNVEWNPTSEFCHKFVVSAGETADIFSWNGANFSLENSLVGHTRSITDLNWHPSEPYLLTTCSIDTFIHFWDTRENRKPVQSVSAVAGASQIKWNKINGNLLASGHEGCMRIWDRRKTTQALFYISAHLCKIYCVDWSPIHEQWIASCSNDQTVRFFNLSDRSSEPIIETNNSVWRVRYTPNGESVVTEVVPPLRRAENSLQLWSIYDRKSPKHTFYGHSDVVLEYEWRNKATSRPELVTWSRDRTLRIWRVHPQLLKYSALDFEDDDPMMLDSSEVCSTNEVNLDKLNGMTLASAPPIGGDEDVSNDEVQPKGSIASTDNDVDSTKSSTTPESHAELVDYMHSLQDEFDNIRAILQSFRLDHVEITCNEETRTCMLTTRIGSTNAVLCITLPPKYPRGAAPIFQLDKRTNFDTSFKIDLIRQINQIEEKLYTEAMNSCGSPNHKYGGQLDYNIPFPRTSGARFCGSGQLVCFTRPTVCSKHPRETTLPRSLSALGANVSSLLPKTPTASLASPQHNLLYAPQLSGDSKEHISISMYYYNETIKSNKKDHHRRAGAVLVYDAMSILPISRQLGISYLFNENDIVASCLHNKEVALSYGRSDLVQVWSMAASIAELHESNMKTGDYVSISNPLGRKTIVHYIETYLKTHDVQTAALLSCMFGEQVTVKEPSPKAKYKPLAMSHYRTLHVGQKETESLLSKIRHFSLLDIAEVRHYDEIRRSYCNILYMWHLIEQRAVINNYIKVASGLSADVEFSIYCNDCKQSSLNAVCRCCRKYSFKCAICHLPVKGCSNFCMACGHGGHSVHILQWFEQYEECPKGCGCLCLQQIERAFH